MYDEIYKKLTVELTYDEYEYLLESLGLRAERALPGTAEELCIEGLIEKITV